MAAASLYFAAPPCGGRCPLLQGLLPGLLSLYSITVTPEINAFIEAAVKELDLAEKNAIGEIGKIFSDAEQTPQN